MFAKLFIGGLAATMCARAAETSEWATMFGSPTFWISLTTFAVAIIGAWKAHSAQVAVNGHLAKQEARDETAKTEKKQEFERILQLATDAARAEGEETARKVAEATAAQVREAVAAQNRARAEAATLARPVAAPAAPSGETAAESGVPLQDLRVTEKPDEVKP